MQRQHGDDAHAVNTGVGIGVHHIFQGEVKPGNHTSLLSIWCLQNRDGINTKPALISSESDFCHDSETLIFKAHKSGAFDQPFI